MLRRTLLSVAVLTWIATAAADAAWAKSNEAVVAVVCHQHGTFAERLAAREVRRYLYLRTGRLLPIVHRLEDAPEGGVILVTFGCPTRREHFGLAQHPALDQLSLPVVGDKYALKTISHEGRSILVLAGGYPAGPLYAAYDFAERLGVRFYLHGDVIPVEQIPLEMPDVHKVAGPLFNRRGIQPFHDFPEGPDWWDTDTYKAILGQLPKLRMNFFGLHTYPEGGVGPEPLTWIGSAGDVNPDGTVKFSYPSRHFTTANPTGAWGYRPTKTSDYTFGAAALYDRDDFAPAYMRIEGLWNQMSPDECNELFNRMGRLLDEAFGFARKLGIKTCLGTETPLVIPTPVKERLKAQGKDPADPAVVQEVYEGLFRRIMKTHPLDYYWFWTPEGWTWRETNQEQIDATLADLRAAIAAAEKVKAPFTLATCGWVLGPAQDRALFDNVLPKNMPMSCINRQVGHDPVEPGFAHVEGRPKWAIPWLEDDPAMISPQLWAGRMRKDAVDARRYGCTGLLGIHWRTRILGPNVSALAKAAWDQSGWGPGAETPVELPEKVPPDQARRQFQPQRHAASDDFYADWARQHFGPEAAEPIAALFVRMDGRLPRPSTWVRGPGGSKPDGRPWDEVKKDYAFVDELAALRPRVQGAGNLERFDFWLNQFRYLRSNAQVNCTWARFNEAMKQVKAQKDAEAQKRLARELVLPIRKELVAQVADVHRFLLASVTTTGLMGNVTNWQQHIMPGLLTEPGEELARILGEPLPADCLPSPEYQGEPRLFLPAVRTCLVQGEPLRLTAVVLSANAVDVAVYWRPLGSGQFAKVSMDHVARGVFRATLPAEALKEDLEYYVQAGDLTGLYFPATAPKLNQTVVVVPAGP